MLTAHDIAPAQAVEALRQNGGHRGRENQQHRVAEAQPKRRAIYSLFMHSYYEAERAVLFLEPHRVEESPPALFAKQGRRKLGESESPSTPVRPPSVSGVVAASDEGAQNAAPGMPGNSPILGSLDKD